MENMVYILALEHDDSMLLNVFVSNAVLRVGSQSVVEVQIILKETQRLHYLYALYSIHLGANKVVSSCNLPVIVVPLDPIRQLSRSGGGVS